MPRDHALEIDKLDFHWPGINPFGISVDGLKIAAGERVLLLGASGCGKSTLLSLICGIVTPQSGTVKVLGQDMAGMAPRVRDRYRAEHCGVIFQMFNLLPYASALDNVLLPLSFAKTRQQKASANRPAKEEGQRLLASLGLDGIRLADTKAAHLSIGQQQRVAVARALIGAPELIIADEPTSALDVDTQGAFLDLLFGQLEETGCTLIMVSHDERLAPHFDRIVKLPEIACVSGGGADE